MTPSDSPAAASRRELRAVIYSDHAGNPPYRLTETRAIGDGSVKVITDEQTKHRAEDSERYIVLNEKHMVQVVR